MKKRYLLAVFYLILACNNEDAPLIENQTIVEQEEIKYPVNSLNSVFNNALISDQFDNIERKNPIKIIEFDKANNRIKTNYSFLKNLQIKPLNNQSWFITQNAEASTVIEIINVDLQTRWITLGKTFAGQLNTDTPIEFFNPFINYEIINDSRLFEPYPTTVSEGTFNYIQPGGIIEKKDGTYTLLTPIVFGAHDSRSIYYATSPNLENWTFNNTKILSTDMIPFAKTRGNVFSVGNPLVLDNGTLLVLLGVQQPNNNYTCAYMIIDENLTILQQPKEIMIPDWHGQDQNSFPLSITKFNNKYRILLHKRNPEFIDREIHEIVSSDLFETLDSNKSIISSTMIHKGTNSSGYLRGKADDASYITFKSKLYILIGGEERYSNYLTSNNREYGLMNWDNNNNTWNHDIRSPLVVNPVQLHNKYPIYSWAWDHLGGFVSPIIKNNTLYIYMAFGTDNPDYYIAGIKIPLN